MKTSEVTVVESRQQLCVVVTGVGSPGARGVIRSLHKVRRPSFRIIGADASPHAIGAVWCDAFYTIPRANEPHFQATVEELCRLEHADVLISLVTNELPVLAKMQPSLKAAGTLTALSSPDSLEVANDKGRLMKWLQKRQVSVPQFAVVDSVVDLKMTIDSLIGMGMSVCFKPIHGDGSRGFRVIDERAKRAEALFNEKPDSTYISREELFRILSDTRGIPPLLVMEYLPGEEYSVDVLADQGTTLVAVPRLRQQMSGGITTQGLIEDHSDVVDYVKQVVAVLGLHGNVGVQVRRNQDGNVRIVEVNPRLQGTTIHASAAGVNLPWLGVKLALGEEISPDELRVTFGTRMVRCFDEVFFDANDHAFTFEGLDWRHF